MQAAGDGHRHLLGGHAALDRLDHELGGVELLLAQDELRQHAGSHRAVAVRAVADLGPRDERDEAVEEDDAELAGEGVAVGLAEHARAVGDVDLAVEHRLDQALHLRRQVLAVGVERHHDLGAGFDHQPVAGAQRRAAAAVDHVAGDDRAVLGGDVAGPVARAVVDDQHRGLDAADLARHQVEHLADVLGLVVGGDEDRDPAAEALRQLRLAELLPGQPLEHRRELARVARRLRERPQDQEEEDEDREDGEAEDAAAVALLEGEGGEQLVGQLGAGDDRQAEPDEQQDQHVDVAQRAPAQHRVGDDRRRHEQAGGAQRRQL